MHIPDGYLSPSTCAVMYAGAAPFWYMALQRVKKTFNARLIPLISLFSALSFVIMMFNVPLPGGTTGHAVGMGILTVVLGPWASILAISVALAIQAIFFGDGGITCYGANCFNMAIVGSLVSYLVYRTISGQAALTSPRRIVAAALAGYIAINVSAFCAGTELGIQPALFHDTNGAPLYAPYPLSISIPAMVLGHLSFAGIAELVIAGALVAYLQRTDPSLLRATAPGVAETEALPLEPANIWMRTRGLWLILAVMMVATPLGLLAAGSAWGEWSPDDFKDPDVRSQIATASQGVVPPAQAPSGLEKLSSIWTAPMPDYTPTFIKSPQLGYILSAVFGTGLIILIILFIGWVAGLVSRLRPKSNA
jgi:cobalt/nickel transport system permease protein